MDSKIPIHIPLNMDERWQLKWYPEYIMEVLNSISSQTINESIWHDWTSTYTLYHNSYYIYMPISIHKKWFTLVELLIVISIIGVLVAGLYPKLTGYLARGRDSAKITEIAQLNAAIVLYQVANKTYAVPWAGWQWGPPWNSMWWINFVDGLPASYPKSLFTGLQEKWFMNKSLHDNPASSLYSPAIIYNIAPCITTAASQNLYMLYFDDSVGKYSISGYLENPQPAHIANIQASWNGIWANGTCTNYGRNYAVGIN